MKSAIVFLFMSVLGFAQSSVEIEALKKKEKLATNDRDRLNLSLQILNAYRSINIDSTLHYTEKSKQIIKKNNWNSELGKALIGEVFYYAERSEPDKALKLNQQSFNLNLQNKDNFSIADNYVLFGRIYHVKTDHPNAIKNYLNAIDYGLKSKNYKTVNYAYRSLAFIYLDQGDEKKSENYINKAIALALENNQKTDLAYAFGVQAEIFRTLKQYDKAAEFFEKSNKIFVEENNDFGLAWLYTNWSLLVSLEDLNKGLLMMKKAQEIWDRISPNHFMSVVNHYNMGVNYYDLYHSKTQKSPFTKPQLLQNAQNEFEISSKIAKKIRNMQFVMFNTGEITRIDYDKNDLESYSNNIDRYYAIKDSLYSQDQKNKIAQIENQKIIDLKNSEIQHSKNQKWYYFGVILLFAIIGTLLWLFYRQSQKKNAQLHLMNKELDEANKNKMRFFGILNHDLKSPVTSLVHFLHLQKTAPELIDSETKERLTSQTTKSAEQLLEQMEDLLLWSKSQMEAFSPEKKWLSCQKLFAEVEREFNWVDNIDFEFRNPDHVRLFSDKEFLKTILRNIINNAIKVLQHQPNGKIICEATETENTVNISVKDNGGGANLEKFKALYDDKESIGIKNGLGLHVIRDLAKSIDAEVEVKSDVHVGETEIILHIKKI